MAKANILVVDSDEGFGYMLKEGLQNSGQYAAKWVHSGSEALQVVAEDKFDLVIIDMALTDMSPVKLVQAIREAKNGMRIMKHGRACYTLSQTTHSMWSPAGIWWRRLT
jgi:CheY-like chemotaxis protein